jgi:tetratricopeptide (TPR) repeat protein
MAQETLDETPRKRWWLKPLIGIVLLAVLSVGGWRVYRSWQLKQLVAESKVLIERGDYQKAALGLRRALQINQFSPEANRTMAELTDKLGLPEGVEWRRATAGLAPGSVPDALAFANSALRHGEAGVAQNALAGIGKPTDQKAQFHTSAGNAAVAQGQYSEADQHFAQALEADPKNEAAEYNLAVSRIHSPDVSKRDAAVEALRRLTGSERVGVLARRALITGLQREQKLEEALRLGEEQQASPGVEFRDRIAHLDLLVATKSTEVEKNLEQVKSAALTSAPSDAAALMNWLRMASRTEEAITWAATLPPALSGHRAMMEARAECLVALGKWSELMATVEPGDWKDFEFIRLAYRARAGKELGDRFNSKTTWTFATIAARRPEHLSKLALMASRWGWRDELQETLWAATKQPNPDWALQMLHRLYREDGDTSRLLRVAEAALKVDENNLQARNNVAMLSLLLKRDAPAALESARQLHANAPHNPEFASTYAFALHQAGRSAEGLAILKQLSPEQLREPAIASYYALLLDAAGEKTEASSFAKMGQAATVLPEEKSLFSGLTAQ